MTALRVLIVDDDPDFAESLAMVMEVKGCQVEVVYSGEAAIQQHELNDFDITFMDMRLPKKSGVQCLHTIRKSKPKSKIVMMTGYCQGSMLDEAIRLGAWAILHKPFDLNYIVDLLDQARSTSVLIVDDDPDFADSLQELLEGTGRKVQISNTSVGLEIRLKKGGIDLLILDLKMPKRHGLEAFKNLRTQGFTVPTIIVTAYARQENSDIRQLKKLDPWAIMHKPIDPGELLLKVEQAISTHESQVLN